MFIKLNKLSKTLIERLTKLKFIQFMGIGYRDYLDVEHAEARGITVRGIGEYGSNCVAEFAIGFIFSAIRGITVADRRMKNKTWDMKGLLGRELTSSTVGIIGTGAVGSLVSAKLSLLGAKVMACDIYPKQELIDKYGVMYVDIKTLMAQSDVVSVHLKYSPETENFVSKELLGLMKPGSYFINTARAQIVDYKALEDLLKRGVLAGAAIDVHNEQPPADWSLSLMDNVIATPHMGYYTKVANTNMLRLSVESVLHYVKLR
jgi:phosphoglycerate dehydrogenase-like enzyme